MSRSGTHKGNGDAAMGRFCGLLGAAITLASSPAIGADQRHGFTSELGFGVAYVVESFNGGAGESRANVSKLGIAPLSFSLGAFVDQDLALMFRMGSTSYFEGSRQRSNEFYGAALQCWLSDEIFLGGGAGLSLRVNDGFFSPERAGLGLSVRAGWSFASFGHHSFALAIELFPTFYPGTTTYVESRVLGTAFDVQWQYF